MPGSKGREEERQAEQSGEMDSRGRRGGVCAGV